MRSLAAWSFSHRRIVLGLWLLALVGANLVTRAAGTAYSNDFTLPNTESTRALQLLESVAPKEAGDSEQIVFGTEGGKKVTDPAVSQRIQAMLAKISQLPHVSMVVSPYDPRGQAQQSQDGTVAFATSEGSRGSSPTSARS